MEVKKYRISIIAEFDIPVDEYEEAWDKIRNLITEEFKGTATMHRSEYYFIDTKK